MEEPLKKRIQVNIDGQLNENITRLHREEFILTAIAPGGEDVFGALPDVWRQRLKPFRTIAQGRPLTKEEQQKLEETTLAMWEKSTEEER